MIKIISVLIFIVFCTTAAFSQKEIFTRQDTLRGSITAERAWWDLTYYHLQVKVNPADSSFAGSNLIGYRVIEPNGFNANRSPAADEDYAHYTGWNQPEIH
jgi:hypothetical protein